MSRYIDADKLMTELGINSIDCDKCDWGNGWGACKRSSDFVDCCVAIEGAPTADVRENVRGEWLSGDCMGASCSECGEYFSFRTFSEVHNFNFCPNCGADMRGEEK